MFNNCKVLYHYLYQNLLPVIETSGECRSIVLRILEHYFECDNLAITLEKPLLKNIHKNELEIILKRLHAHEPIQYITKQAPFMNRLFYVTPDVLIPRPETEEGIATFIEENKTGNLSILDIGTGSGCIAISLAKEIPSAQVDALDNSMAALKIAQKNSIQLEANINWLLIDILADKVPQKSWDIFISNPPYVQVSEKESMPTRVLKYEPACAIFVRDENPLLFYEKIIEIALTHLKRGGKIYFEINEKHGKAVAQALSDHYFSSILIRKDLQGKDRWVRATRS